MQVINVFEKLRQVHDYWNPAIVGHLNGQHVKLVKFKGTFTWHHHEQEDEMFYVLKGNFVMEFKDKQMPISEGEFIIVPRGVEHRPVAAEEVHVMLFEPAGTLNTGNVTNELTKTELNHI
ncbi:MAG: cupin domain-containing protein [Bacteroidota bacterium]|jgi:mannose-6-phosphate isomerase-like protein (cupin superfamily)|nr:cupin domain-containing protein [Bacteroidota bacterium]